MGWGWCSGTVLCGDLAISRGVDVSFRSWDALLDRRLPVGAGHGGLSLSGATRLSCHKPQSLLPLCSQFLVKTSTYSLVTIPHSLHQSDLT